MALGSLPADSSQRLAADPTALAGLKLRAGQDPKGAAREAAKLLESLFMQQMLKHMRAAWLDTGLDNEGSKLGTEMLDSQLAQQLAGKPGGLADIVARQLERQLSVMPGDVIAPTPATPATPTKPAEAAQAAPALPGADAQPAARATRIPERAASAFVEQYSAAAQAVAQHSGIPANFMLAQAGHETGWGQRGITGRDGTVSNNLFGIKAGAGWSGPTVDVLTTEFRDGQAQKLVQRFRAYASPADSFADYAKMVATSPRYQAVRAAGNDAQQFAQGLQSAGYATDPAYAAKLGRAINMTLSMRSAQRQG